MKVFKLDEFAILPTINHLGDAGMDFYALKDYVISQTRPVGIIETGIGILIPDGYMGLIKPKGGADYMIGGGVVDSNYTGEILFKILNHYHADIIIRRGDAVGQMVILKNLTPTGIEEIPLEDVPETNRGATGGIVRDMTWE